MKQPGEWNKDIECSVNWLLKYAYGPLKYPDYQNEGKEEFIKEYLLKKEEDNYNPEMRITPESAERRYNYLKRCNIVQLLYSLDTLPMKFSESLNETEYCPLCYSTINKEEEE